MKRLGQVLQEVHRRSLWQLLTSYGVGAWVVLQLAEVLSSLVGLPLWFGPVILALLGTGLILILLTALIQGGVRSRTPGAAPRGWLFRTFTWRNALVGIASVVVTLLLGTGGYMGLRAAGVGPIGTLVAKGVLQEAEPIILAEFENRTQDPTLAETVTALLRIDLAQSPTITLLEPVQLAPVLRRMQRDPATPLTFDVAREVAQREGLKAIVSGEVLPLGSGFVISARVVSVATGESLAAARASASDVGQIPDAIDKLSAVLRERIGESLRTIQAEPALDQVTTASIEALRDYARAGAANDAGDPDRALTLLSEAIDKDSTFAMAHRKLAVILTNQGMDTERARTAFTRAFEIRDRLTERERHLAEGAYYTYVDVDREATVAAYETVLAKYPTDRVALNNLAIAYGQQGRVEDAERLYERSIAQGGAPALTYMNAVEVRFGLGWTDSARATLRDFRNEYPTNVLADVLASRLASATFDYPAAESAIRTFRERAAGSALLEAQASLELGSIVLVQGKMTEALEAFRRTTELAARADGPAAMLPWDLEEPVLLAFARVWYFEDAEGALRLLDSVPDSRYAEIDPAGRDHLRRATIYAMANRPERARAMLAEYEATVPAAARKSGEESVEVELARGAIAEAEGGTDAALVHYRSAATMAQDCPLCGLMELATAYDRAGRADSAIAVYERYLETAWIERLRFDSTNLWRVLLRVGALSEERGDNQRAITLYTRFLDLWKDADPELQPRVREIRERVARLTAARG